MDRCEEMKDKIRILHIAQAAGGVDRYIRMLLKYLDKKVFENILVCSQDFYKQDYKGLVDFFEQIEMTRTIGGNDLKAIKEVRNLIKKYNPDILVITGHDAYYRKKRSGNNYKNTSNFVLAVKEARKYESSNEKLFIIAGACQSNYEELIKAGANFASSHKRINIHALDPAIIAACLAFSDKNNNIDLIKILAKTKYGADGIGGIITKGTMYIGYPR